MAFARAVWQEGDNVFEGVLPINWIDEERKVLRWPKKGRASAWKNKTNPAGDWLDFPLIKIKFTSESEKECTEFNYTSSAQTDSEDPPELGKRAIKRKQFSDCIEEPELSDEEPRPKKSKSTGLLSKPPKPPNMTNAHPQRSPSPSNHSDVGGESWQDSSPSSPRNQSIRSPSPSSRSPSPSSSHSGNHRGGSHSGGPPRASNNQSMRSPSPSSSHSGNHRGGSHSGGPPRASNSQSIRTPSLSSSHSGNHRGGSRPGGSSRASNSQSMRSPSPSSSHSGNHRGGSHPGGSSRSSNSQSMRSPSPSSSHSGNHRGGSRPGGSPRASNSQSMRSPSPSPRNHRGSRPGGSPLASNSIRARSPRERNSVFPMENDKFQRCVMKKLVEIMEVVKRIEADHQRGGTNLLKTMTTMDEVLMLEDKLNQEEERQALLAQLSKVGGKDIKDCVAKILNRLMTNGLMSHFNMMGHGGKTAFKAMTLYGVLTAAVKKWSERATDHDIGRAVADQLKHAPGRSGGGGFKNN
ncbi:uncharacterized protein LOC143137569 isoform X2 [Alosa pseudoharengus]|uniref:uncharacterized protein LOC143137569 isoform X2 n=1 Tax=Alosa pseudoharengus TaxID=34774 RepID=UPI003F8BDCB5